MKFSNPSLFSIRNFILVTLAVFTIRSLGVTFNPTDAFFPTEEFSAIQSGELEQAPPSILDAFLQGNNANSELEIIPVFAERDFIEEILDGNDLFILTSDSEVAPRAWLSYLAPEGLPFDLTMLNASIALESLAAGSQAFFNETTSLEIDSISLVTEQHSLDIQAPFEVFFGIDLTNVASSEIEISTFAEGGLPVHSISDFQGTNLQGSIPEPSSTFLLFLALISPLLARKR